jgi:hypothetical protein
MAGGRIAGDGFEVTLDTDHLGHFAFNALARPAGRDQTSGTPKVGRLPSGADDPGQEARLWTESERPTEATFNS